MTGCEGRIGKAGGVAGIEGRGSLSKLFSRSSVPGPGEALPVLVKISLDFVRLMKFPKDEVLCAEGTRSGY